MSLLDGLLGRTALRERIADLEAETDRLEARLEAESDRRAAAVRDRQEAEERANRLEDRIAQLEGELDRTDEGIGSDLEWRRRERLRGERLADVVDLLSSIRTAPEGALTATVGADGGGSGDGDGTDADEDTREATVPDAVRDVLGDHAPLVERAAPCLFLGDDAGVVSVALSPPVCPTVEATWDDRFRLDRAWFLPDAAGRYALALVRADLFALGVYDGDERVAYRGFESPVKGSHSKGGFSQARFERIRDDQIDDHLDRCAAVVGDVVDGTGAFGDGSENDALDGDGVDRVFLVGQRGVVDALASEGPVDPAATAAVDATGDPEDALDDAFRDFWTTTLSVR